MTTQIETSAATGTPTAIDPIELRERLDGPRAATSPATRNGSRVRALDETRR